jgi:hypothetical protein
MIDDYRGEDPAELVSDQERAEAENPNIGTGTPQTAPHEPVPQTLWERLTGRFKPNPEED